MGEAEQKPDFELVAPVEKSPRRSVAQLEKSYAEYAVTYKNSVRTIKGWVAIGKDAGDLPPLSAPEKMPGWWSSHMKQKCPANVLDAARVASAGETPHAAPADASKPVPKMMPLAAVELSTLDEDLEHLKEQLARARTDLLQAQCEEPPDFVKIETKQRKWRELRAEVEKAEEAAFKLKAKQGRTVDVDQFAAEMQPRLVTVATSVRSLLSRIWPQLKETQSLEAANDLYQAGLDECFSELIGNGFVHRETLSLAA